MACYNIMAIIIEHRMQKALNVQEVLTKHGCSIKMRLGLHEAGDDFCSDEGLVILQVCGEDENIKALEDDLNSMEGVKAKTINICS